MFRDSMEALLIEIRRLYEVERRARHLLADCDHNRIIWPSVRELHAVVDGREEK